MKLMVLGLCCGMLLAISAIADVGSQDAWFIALDHNGDGQITAHEALKFQQKALKQASTRKVSK